jgi:sarcosine oxidase delta subunit
MESYVYIGLKGNEKAHWEHFEGCKRALNCARVRVG